MNKIAHFVVDMLRYRNTIWSHIIFEHASTFDTLAMDPKKKKDILDDLITFSKSKDYYKEGHGWFVSWPEPRNFLGRVE
ncbi:AAA-ATPase ASD, mitochondrial-like [Helianthus annuus]|uniref:AAA-ATPase ASD, mitochondrial-like n=1 Tax=Helianthus annuus TaxID=4232 RepID=UPI000B8FFCB9|nr:AAA-ATPase ASD, mitochondrial-like [Helianthus annuus]